MRPFLNCRSICLSPLNVGYRLCQFSAQKVRGYGTTNVFFGFGYLVGRAPKLGHRTDGLSCVNNLPKVVT